LTLYFDTSDKVLVIFLVVVVPFLLLYHFSFERLDLTIGSGIKYGFANTLLSSYRLACGRIFIINKVLFITCKAKENIEFR